MLFLHQPQYKNNPVRIILSELEKAKKRQATSTGGANPQLRVDLSEAEGRTRDKVAQAVGLGSGRSYEKVIEIHSKAIFRQINDMV